MIRNPTPPFSDRTGPDETETEQSRASRIRAMREAYLSGTLDLSVPDDSNGIRRLLRDVFSSPGRGTTDNSNSGQGCP